MDTFIATGTFEVNLVPQNDNEFTAGRMTIDKQYSGDIQATGKGQMLSIRTQVEGSASYVALETVSGELSGKSGSFTLQHLGTMNRGESALKISIVPDSGTGELTGISGTMTVKKNNDSHSYILSYQFAEANE